MKNTHRLWLPRPEGPSRKSREKQECREDSFSSSPPFMAGAASPFDEGLMPYRVQQRFILRPVGVMTFEATRIAGKNTAVRFFKDCRCHRMAAEAAVLGVKGLFFHFEMGIMTNRALACGCRLMGKSLLPVAIHIMTIETELGKAFQEKMIALIAMGRMTADAVLVPLRFPFHRFLLRMALQAENGRVRRQQKGGTAGVRLMARTAATGSEGLMAGRVLHLRFNLRMTGNTGLGPFLF